MIFLLRTSGRLIQKVARLITQGGQVDLKGSSTDSKTCTQPTKIFLLHTSSDRAQRNPLHSKAVRQGLKTPSFDPKVAQPIPKTTRQGLKKTQLVPKGGRQVPQATKLIFKAVRHIPQNTYSISKVSQQAPQDTHTIPKRPSKNPRRPQLIPRQPNRSLFKAPRHQLHSVPSSASKPLNSKTLQQKTLQNDCSVLYKLFPFRLCHSTVPWTWQRRV